MVLYRGLAERKSWESLSTASLLNNTLGYRLHLFDGKGAISLLSLNGELRRRFCDLLTANHVSMMSGLARCFGGPGIFGAAEDAAQRRGGRGEVRLYIRLFVRLKV